MIVTSKKKDFDLIKEIIIQISKEFRTFGGGKGSEWNFLAEALKNQPSQFAAGVSVEDVVKRVIQLYVDRRR